MTAIKSVDLTKKYKDVTAVGNLSFEVEKGELLSVLGTNGAGKTTTVRILSGLTKPDSGDALLFNKSIVKETIEAKKIMNISPQETAVAPNLTVRENLELICGLYGLKREDTKRRVDKMLTDFSLSEIEKRKAKTLSGGWSRRLSIAMALITEPEILFLDEPTIGLDVLARRELWSVVNKLKNKMTIVLTTHYLEEAEALSDKVLIMNKGKSVAFGSVDEIKGMAETENFEDAFVKLCGGEIK